VLAALDTLPMRQRQCVVLRFYEDMTDVQIAEALGISPGSVKQHLHRAMQSLTDRLEALA
jgi:RNA polymerase sigma-70 factor (ECF subfamily)